MPLRRVRLSSWDQEADTSLDEYEIPEGGLREFEHAGRRFRFHHTEDMSSRGIVTRRLVYTDMTPKPER